MADGRKDDLELPRQQDQAEGEPEDIEGGGSDKDNLYVPRQQDQAEGEPEDVEGDLKAQKQKQQE
jgi:hypothetical protein